MREEKRFIFTEEDYKLLKRPIPVSPCRECFAKSSYTCGGCPEYTKYKKDIKPYEDNNLVNVGFQLRRYYAIQRDINKLNIELSQLLAEIPDDVIDNIIKKK